MTREELIEHFGGRGSDRLYRRIAAFLYVSPSTISRVMSATGELPADFQGRVHVLTRGALRADPEAYAREHEDLSRTRRARAGETA